MTVPPGATCVMTARSAVTVCAATNTWSTFGDGNGVSPSAATAAVVNVAAATRTAAAIRVLLIVPPCRLAPLLRQRPGELHGERAAAAVVGAGELQRAFGLQQLPRRLDDGRLAADAEDLAGLVAAALGDVEHLERDGRGGGAGHRARAEERDAVLRIRAVARPLADDLPGADLRPGALAGCGDVDDVVVDVGGRRPR